MSMYPTAVVTDTTDGMTLDRAPDGKLLTPATAEAYAAELNTSRKPKYQTWRAFRLVPNATPWLVEEIVLDPDGEQRVARHWLIHTEDERAAFVLAATAAEFDGGRGFYFGPDELEPVDDGYRWAAADGSSVAYEVRRLTP